MISFRITKNLKYILLSKSGKGHGIHSPFVFNLISRVFRNKIDPDIVSGIEKIRKRLVSDNRLIEVRDLGSGSVKMKPNSRRVSDIAKYSPVPKKYGILLSNMAAEFGKPFVVELGTSIGISTMYMASADKSLKIKTIEGCPATATIAKENFREAGFSNIELFTGSFEEVLPAITNCNERPGLVFIDGDHRKEPVIDNFKKIAASSDTGTVVIVDDINYSPEMEEAWNEIRKDKRVSVTVDIYRMGIVFFRTGISHNDYIIRY
jgi:predicted O-methyltransferase YrrM